MDAWMAFVSIMAIIAIVLLAGGLIAFLGHMIIGAFDSDKKVNSVDVYDNKIKQITNTANTAEKEEEFDFEAIDYAKAEKEKDLAKNDESFGLDELEDINEDDLENIENRLKEDKTFTESNEDVDTSNEDESDDLANIDDLLDEISDDVVDEEKEKSDNQITMSEELASYNIDEILNASDSDEEETDTEDVPDESDNNDDGSSEVEVDLTEEETDNEEVVNVEETENSETDNTDKQVINDLKAQLAELNRQLEQARTQTVETVSIEMTEEQCLERLAVLEERLKNVKREYKINMKEYRPLKKVMKDLEKYQTKLRRKDAQVAKKTVSLYGVNNYVDMDKENAEKLSNELDLLDGLRLSVSRCEDVINANKDRYPILEHTNKILEDQIAHIEADIESTKLTLEKIREKQGD